MSVNATRFAWECDLSKTTKRSAKRLVLLALADRANNDGVCFPSIARICQDTCLDRKTAMNTINDLIELGLIEDTGEKKGATKQVRVLKFVSLNPPTPVDNSKINEEISQTTVVNLLDNCGKFPSNSGKFGTRNLKEPINESKINFKSEDLKIIENDVSKGCTVKDVSDDSDANNLSYAKTSVVADSSHVKYKCCTTIPECDKHAVKRSYSSLEGDAIKQEKTEWIPRHLYAKHMKKKRIDEQLNKEPFIPKSMIKGWEDGMTGNPNATKGIPDHLLNNPALAKILKMKGKRI